MLNHEVLRKYPTFQASFLTTVGFGRKVNRWSLSAVFVDEEIGPFWPAKHDGHSVVSVGGSSFFSTDVLQISSRFSPKHWAIGGCGLQVHGRALHVDGENQSGLFVEGSD